ncbi:hypothetical protein TcCL_NonESM06667 [Trypanosoma cruzi]|nr:hypothetical protein TcCL_NonESM06667 [Trypanosoma cruzi]
MMDEGSLAAVAGVVGARSVCVVWWLRGFGYFPLAVEMSWMEMEVDMFSSCMVGGCWRCVPSLRACRLVVRELCGWACCLLLMLSALSLYPLCPVHLPLAFFFFCLTDQLTGSSGSTTGDDDCDNDGAAPCWSLRSCAAAARP